MANQIPQPDAALHTASHLMQYHDLIESIVAAMDARDAYTAKHSDRINATKALCALRGFDAQPEMMVGATINISLPFTPQPLGHHRIIEHEES